MKQNIRTVDYKDVETLKKFLNPSGRIISKRINGTSARFQRNLAEAVKHARFMGLLPYLSK